MSPRDLLQSRDQVPFRKFGACECQQQERFGRGTQSFDKTQLDFPKNFAGGVIVTDQACH